ncbi:MAG: hypothetical protein SGI97_02400 [candidate division Zixibacteria bacterium]|nr:hypothetical protein [candidate division Zixibacteria bacterium]
MIFLKSLHSQAFALALLALVLLNGSPSSAAPAVEFSFSVYQKETKTTENRLLYADTSAIIKGIPATGFMVALSLDVEINEIDSAACAFTTHIVTFGPPTHNYSKKMRVEYGLPARIESLKGKNGALYSFVIVPLKQLNADTTNCGYKHNAKDVFEFKPTAHTDLYYIPNSLAQFHWAAIKGLLEDYYDRFDALNKFTASGKYNVYLTPCPVPSVLWDKRFGLVVDPTRNTSYTIHNKSYNSADPFALMLASIYRNYGYAPAFLSEGYAGYLSAAVVDMKDYLKKGTKVNVIDLLDTYTYLVGADPKLADRTAATFVRFIINEYNIDQFLTLYRQADDITLQATIEKVYGKPIATLENEWRKYIDTVTIRSDKYLLFASEAEAMIDYPRMLMYSQKLLPLATTSRDTLIAYTELSRSYFLSGDYSKAVEYQTLLAQKDTASAINRVTLAGYKMMDGQYDEALIDLKWAKAKDSGNGVVQFNLAVNSMIRGDKESARDIFRKMVADTSTNSAPIESRALLGHLLLQSKVKADKGAATKYFNEAVSALERSMSSGSTPVPTNYLWRGIAHLGLGEIESALSYLETSLFLESSTFYIGMINLWMGKANDLKEERQIARQHYGAVLSNPSAVYHQEEARRYLETPYSQ